MMPAEGSSSPVALEGSFAAESGDRAGDVLAEARAVGLVSALDEQFARRLCALYGETGEGVLWAAALASRQEAAGHVCADLGRLAREGLVVESVGETRSHSVLLTHAGLEAWQAALRASALVGAPDDADESAASEARPLVLDGQGRLYLLRSYRAERRLASRIRDRAACAPYPVDWSQVEAALERLLPHAPDGIDDSKSDAALDPARQALRVALSRPLGIVTGGPGTGKTTLVVRLIALLVEQSLAAGQVPPRVLLLAPTGKAAAAMAQASSRAREQLDLSAAVRAALPRTAQTIHRALHPGTRLDAFGRPKRHALEADVVVVDEASMVDLVLMDRLFEACEEVDRIVLVGDPGQLVSVDSGAVLAELCEGAVGSRVVGESTCVAPPASAVEGLSASVVTLRERHRFSETGAIGRLADAIRDGDAARALSLLADRDLPEIERSEIASPRELSLLLAERCRVLQARLIEASAPEEKLIRMADYRVLCAHRRGPVGVEALAARLDAVAAAERRESSAAGWWPGRMLLVTRNAPDQRLWNGDVGLIEKTDAGLRALFADEAGGVRILSAGRLPTHESAIAMSVHKSQGSEFDAVDLVLGTRDSAHFTRELLYTGVTRARETLRVHASEALLRAAIERRVRRDSGLGERVWAD